MLLTNASPLGAGLPAGTLSSFRQD